MERSFNTRDEDDSQAHGKKQQITAACVRERCLKPESGVQEVKFEEKEVTDRLDLEEAELDRPIRFTECNFTDQIILTGAHAAKGIRLERCKILSLNADRLDVDGDLVLENVHSDGDISLCEARVTLCGARVTGHLRCSGSEFSHPQPEGKAFNGKGMMVGGSALFDNRFSSVGAFILTSARIGGAIDMSGGSFSNTVGPALVAEGVRVKGDMFLGANFKGPVILKEAHVSGTIKCSGGHFVARGQTAIDAERIEADVVLLSQGFTATGEVCLNNSKVTGSLLCNDGTFCNRGKIALNGDGLDCPDVRLRDGFKARGAVSLLGAVISRELNCSNGTFDNAEGYALRADGLICGGKVYLNETFHATGEVVLRNARITTELNCSNGTFKNGEGSALSAGGLTCEGNVYLNDGFQAERRVELVNATVGRELNCNHGKFGILDARDLTAAVLNCDGGTVGILDARGVRVGAKFDWRPSQNPEGVDISFADVELMLDGPKSWPIKKTESKKSKLTILTEFICRKAGKDVSENYKTKLDGFTFRNVDKDISVRKRIDWLHSAKYAPDVYEQLSRIYRKKGLDSEARKIAIAGQRDRRKRGGMPWASRLWNYFLDKTVRYGYEMYRPFLLVLIVGLVGTVLFYLAQAHGLMEAVSPPQGKTINANKCTSEYPCFFPLTYSFELFLPVVNLRQVAFWLPSGTTGWSQALLVWVWLAILAGWVFTVAIAAGIGRMFNRQS
jgi:hypothetical protein